MATSELMGSSSLEVFLLPAGLVREANSAWLLLQQAIAACAHSVLLSTYSATTVCWTDTTG